MTTADPGDDMSMTPWLIEHGQHLPAVLVAECSAPDVWLLLPMLRAAGFTHPARVGRRPAGVPGWRAVYRPGGTPELTITHPARAGREVLFYVGDLHRVPPRWDFAVGELGWCVLYVVLGDLVDLGEARANLGELVKAADVGRVLAGRVAIERAP